jgi:hypothetical protein
MVALLVGVPAHAKEEENKEKVDDAIKKALVYLARSQNADGTWSSGGRRGGPKHPAITGLAVMAFLASGNVPGEGPYGKTVEKGVRAVIKMQHPNGLIATEGGHEMYHHGICTLMLAEVTGMTQGQIAKDAKAALEKAVKVVLLAQRKGRSPTDNYRGGWRYRVAGSDSDMSVTGWQLMALRAAKNVGCDVPPEVIDRAIAYVRRSQNKFEGSFCYTPQGGATVPCTGTGILCLAVCGEKLKQSFEAKKAGDYLLKRMPRWGSGHFCYSIYYCTQATFQLGGNYWATFRPHMHSVLLDHQSRLNGSWNSNEGYGPNYATSMAVLALAVEYRFLPIYQRGEEPTDKK